MSVEAVVASMSSEALHYMRTGEILGAFPNNGRQQCARLRLIDGNGAVFGCETTPLGFAVKRVLER